MPNNKFLKKISVGLFFVLLSLALFAYMEAEATKAENLKSFFTPMIAKGMSENLTSEQLSVAHKAYLQNCTYQNTITIPTEPQAATLSCDEIRNSNSEQLPTLIAASLFDSMYYKDYGCDFITCLRTLEGTDKLMVMMSSTANKFYNSIFMPLLMLTAISGLGILFFAKDLSDKLKSLGWPILITGASFFVLPLLFKNMPQTAAALVENLNQTAKPVFTALTIVGILLVAASFMVKKKRKSLRA